MDKDKLLQLVAGILGIAALAAPANVGKNPEWSHGYAIWMLGLMVNNEGQTYSIIESHYPETFTYLISGIIVAAGIVFTFITLVKGNKLVIFKWLPGLLMLGGSVMYFIAIATINLDGTLLEGAPIPVGIIFGAVGGILALSPVLSVVFKRK
nr:hypothetical protein [Candidatus Sigynarchaeota archaeon]